jgi:hypothetical protein
LAVSTNKRKIYFLKELTMKKRFFLTIADGCVGGPGAGGSPETGTAGAGVPAGAFSYYVRAGGSDQNDGLSEGTPFKTLRKAAGAAAEGTIKTVTVLGTLNLESEGEDDNYPAAVFTIPGTGGAGITIRGGEEAGVLSGAGAGRMVMRIQGESRVRLEHLVIEGGDTDPSGAGLQIIDRARVTMGEGAVIRDNRSQSSGGGVAVAGAASFMMEGGTISGNTVRVGGGGGVVVGNTASFTMGGGTISGNTAQSGGGVYVDIFSGAVFTKGGGAIGATNSAKGGNVALVCISGIFLAKRDSAAGPELNLDSRETGGAGGWE